MIDRRIRDSQIAGRPWAGTSDTRAGISSHLPAGGVEFGTSAILCSTGPRGPGPAAAQLFSPRLLPALHAARIAPGMPALFRADQNKLVACPGMTNDVPAVSRVEAWTTLPEAYSHNPRCSADQLWPWTRRPWHCWTNAARRTPQGIFQHPVMGERLGPGRRALLRNTGKGQPVFGIRMITASMPR